MGWLDDFETHLELWWWAIADPAHREAHGSPAVQTRQA
jgi:hypothetical protein